MSWSWTLFCWETSYHTCWKPWINSDCKTCTPETAFSSSQPQRLRPTIRREPLRYTVFSVDQYLSVQIYNSATGSSKNCPSQFVLQQSAGRQCTRRNPSGSSPQTFLNCHGRLLFSDYIPTTVARVDRTHAWPLQFNWLSLTLRLAGPLISELHPGSNPGLSIL